MSVIQDSLNTVLRLVGGQQYVSSLNQIARAHAALAQAQRAQAAVQAQANAAMIGGAGGGAAGGTTAMLGFTRAGLVVAALAAVGVAVKDTIGDLAAYDRELLRVEAFQKRLGTSAPTKEVEGFARSLSLSAGVGQTDVLRTVDYLSRYGIQARQAERDTVILARAAQATGLDMAQLAQGIEEARRGHARELFKELGIPIKGVTDQMYSFDQMLRLVDLHTKDLQLGFGNTLPGALSRTQAAWDALRKEFGKLIEPAMVAGLNTLQRSLLGAERILHDLRTHDWADIWRGLHGQAPLGQRFGGAGGSGESASERYLRKIEFNTGPQGALGRATREGGSFAEPGGGLRIRDFNAMMRHTT